MEHEDQQSGAAAGAGERGGAGEHFVVGVVDDEQGRSLAVLRLRDGGERLGGSRVEHDHPPP